MPTKAEKTKQFILESVAPIFNKMGYVGTSLSDITEATGLTKGAIYGNFKDKEELATLAFEYNVKIVFRAIRDKLIRLETPLEHLHGLFEFYRDYYQNYAQDDGCPLLNIALDANHRDPILFSKVQEVIKRLENSIEMMFSEGKLAKQFPDNLDTKYHSRCIFAMIQGSVFMSLSMKNKVYLDMMMDHLDAYVDDLAITIK